MICHISIVQVHFVFFNQSIELFLFLIKYFHIMFIIIVFKLGSDSCSVSSTFSPNTAVTIWDSSLGGGCMIFYFRLFKSLYFLLIEFH